MKTWIEHRRQISACSLLIMAGLLWVYPSSAQFIVTSLADSGPGTLREHISAAKDGDTIDFSVTGTITLNSQLVISNGLQIRGPGARFLKVSGNNTTRVFHLKSGGTTITRLTIADGRVSGANGPVGLNGEDVMGGGILVASGISGSLDYVVVTNNVAVGGRGGAQNQFGSSGNGGNGFGGGIANLGILTLRECSLAGNSAVGGLGGPVSGGMSPGVGGQGWGGGIYSGGGVAYMTRCTISSNNATAGTGSGGPGGGSGGGVYNVTEMNVLTCTVANNTASGSSFDFGGGFANFGPLSIRDSTIAGNQADIGGGLSGSANLGNTILALNIASSGPDCSGSIVSSDYNLIQNTSGNSISGTTTHNITGQNPLLTPLQDNHGGTFGFNFYGFTMLTRMPLPGSPALDKGNATSRDQRGFIRPYDSPLISNAAGGNGSEIGAWEIWPPLELSIQRTGTNVVISWFTNGTALALESVTNLVEGNNWLFQLPQPVRIGDRSYVTNSLLNLSTFYRLAQD